MTTKYVLEIEDYFINSRVYLRVLINLIYL